MKANTDKYYFLQSLADSMSSLSKQGLQFENLKV